jgi:(p)ppGpp synthase/HD superfamily hydrolase
MMQSNHSDESADQVETARRIAERAHAGQADKAGRPYIEHPAYVAAHVHGARAQAAAWLHDVVEDTAVTLDDLRAAGVDSEVVEAVGLLTHDKAVPYMDYIRALKDNPLARQVKRADLAHNSDLSRIPHPTEKDYRRLEKYRRARGILEDAAGGQPGTATAKE